MVIGFLGNIIVCYIYIMKFKVSTTRCFVITLALFDLLACCISIPGEFVYMRENYTRTNIGLCKCLRFCNSVLAGGSAAVLLAIATERYKKICKPLRKQMTIHVSKVAVGLSCLVSFAASWPALVLYGARTVATKYPHINGTECTTQDRFVNTPYPLVYNGVQFVIFIVSTCALIILYYKIWRTISKHVVSSKRLVSFAVNKQQQNKDRSTLANISSTSASELSTPITKHSDATNDVVRTTETRFSEPATSFVTPDSDNNEKTQTLKKPGATVKRRKSSREHKAKKTTLMLFLITLVFVMSFLPHLGLMAARGIHQVMFDHLSPAATAAYNLFLRSYFINSASNPIIYGFCNLKFRTELKTLLGKLFHK